MENQPPIGPNPQPQPVPAKSAGLPKAALLVIYVIVFLVGMLSVFAIQNGSLESTKQELAASKAQSDSKTQIPDKLKSSIDGSKYQAVFMSSGQTYFGKLIFLNDQYMQLSDIYYLSSGGQPLQQNTSLGNANVSLVKLGCELHGPYDQMTINLDRVDFWENLQDNGQVVKAIQAFTRTNPSGQSCRAA